MKINDKHLAHFASCGDPADMEGYLWKKGELNTSYQKRWCILRGNLFFYYERKFDKEPIGVIVLENCFVQLSEGGDSPYTFSIHFTGEATRIYKLTADDDNTCTAWVKALSTSSYRYLKILVDGLENDVETLRTKKLSKSCVKVEDASSAHNSSIPTIGVTMSESNLHDSYHPSSIAKSCSLDDVATTEESFNADDSRFLKFEAFVAENDICAKSSSLPRSRSSSEFHNPVNNFPDIKSLSIKKVKASSHKQKSTVMKKLSPRVGRKKYTDPQTVQKELLSLNTKSLKQANPVPHTTPSLPKQSYKFLEMHEEFRKDIEKMMKVCN